MKLLPANILKIHITWKLEVSIPNYYNERKFFSGNALFLPKGVSSASNRRK